MYLGFNELQALAFIPFVSNAVRRLEIGVSTRHKLVTLAGTEKHVVFESLSLVVHEPPLRHDQFRIADKPYGIPAKVARDTLDM